MFTNTIKSERISVMGAGRSVARRQLETSVGAVVVIAALAIAVSFGARTNANAGDQMAKASTAPVIVHSAVRVVPSEQLQASVKGDRRS